MTQHFILQGIIEDLNWENVPEHEQEKLVAALGDRMQNVVISTLLTAANSEQKQRLIIALESESEPEAVITEVAGEIPNFSKILEQALITEYEHFQNIN